MFDYIIGDIHGRKEVIDAAKGLDGTVLFLGDFLDSFTCPVQDQIYCMQTVLEYAKTGRWFFVFGNHEMSYAYHGMRCSGWNLATDAHMMPLLADMLHYGRYFYYIDNTLFTHAGLTYGICKLMTDRHPELRIQDLLELYSRDRESAFFAVGTMRGGCSTVGGPLWCDLREFRHVPGLRQVFGHTPLPATGGIVVLRDNNYAIDCLAHCAEILHYDAAKDKFLIKTLPIARKR